MPRSPVSMGLWSRFVETRCEELRNSIVQSNLPLVRSVVRRIQARHGGNLDFDDLLHSGCVGLLAAVDTYDPSRGLAFSSFAVPRIRGAVLDDLRRQDATTRLSRARKRELKKAARAVEARQLRAACSIETADELGIDLATLDRWRAHAERGSEVSLDRPLREDDRSRTRLADVVPSGAEARLEYGVEFEEDKQRLTEALIRLPERQRLVLHLYYFEGLQQVRIAEILGVTESRVSQIRTRTLKHLHAVLSESMPAKPDRDLASGRDSAGSEAA